MKQKKYLWRRIFALSLALLLCLNTATAYAAPDTPTGSESTEAVSDVSVNEGDSNLTNKTEDSGKGTETEKTETEEGNKDSGDADSETGDADENEKNTANKPAEGSEGDETDGSDGKDIVSDADASDTDTVVTDTSSEEKQPGEETPEETPEVETPEEEPEEMPEEVKAFLDAVARIPGEITPENLEEAGALLTAALDAYDVLTEAGYGERADVAEAYIRVEAAYAEVQAVLGDEEPVLYATGVTGNVEISGISAVFYRFKYEEHFSPVQGIYYSETKKGKVVLGNNKQSAYEEGTPEVGMNYSWQKVEVISYGKANVTTNVNNIVDVTVTGEGSKLRIDFKPGTREGTAIVKVELPFKYKYNNQQKDGNLYFWYEVTNGEDSDEKPALPTDEYVRNEFVDENDIAVIVRCIDDVGHASESRKRLDSGSYTIGEVEEYDGSNGDLRETEWLWMCKVHVDQEYYLDLWNRNFAGSAGTHYLKDETKDVYAPFYYFKGGYCSYTRSNLPAGWYCLTEDAPVYVDITGTSNIPETDTITGFTKEVVRTAEEVKAAGVDLDLNLEDITFPGEDGTVEIPEDDYITLLYAITVEGSVGVEYKVTDAGAVWVGGSKMGATIPSGGSAVIYVTRDFDADEINEEGYLSNTAKVTWDSGTKPEYDTEETPAKVLTGDTDPDDNDETYTVTINFLEEGTYVALRDSVELAGYSAGDNYECFMVDEENVGGPYIPETITTQDGKTYSLKEGQDNKLSGTVNGNVVINLYYSSPEEPPQNVLTVTAEDVNVVYDGDGHPVKPVAKVGEDEVEAEISIVYVDAEGNEFSDAPVNAGIYTAKVTAKLEGYEDATCEATVTIAKRKLTVTTGSDSKTYDGTPLTNSTAIVVVEGGAVAGEEITATATGSRTEVGSAENTFVLNWGNASESNYEIVERRLGTLTVYAAGGTSNDNPEPTPPGPTPPGSTPPGSEPTPSGTTPAEPGPTPPGPTPATPEPTPTIPVLTVEPVPVVPTTVVPTPVAPTATAALVSSTPEAAVLMDEDVPLANEEEKAKLAEVGDGETPLAGGKGASWALVNFALMNLAIFESLMLLIGYFVNTKNDKEVEEEKRKLKKKGIFRIVSLPIAIISLIAFILTEDITLPTAFVDKYTIVMLIIAVVQTVVVALSNKKYEEEEEEEERKELQFAVG